MPVTTTDVSRPARFQRKRTLDDHDAASRVIVNRAVARAKAGDREALRLLYVTFADNVYGYVCSILRDEYDAEDVTQHVFLKLMHVIGRYEQRSMPFSAWVLRVAHNAAIDHMRARRQIPCEDVRGSDDLYDDAGIEARRSLETALDELPEEQRKVVVLRHVLGMSPGEIAERIGKTENAVHGLHHRARRTMRESLVRLESAPTTVAAA